MIRPAAFPWLTSGFLSATLPRNPDPGGWLAPLEAACLRFEITTRLRLAAFIAETAHESGDLTTLSESFDYSASRLMAVWPRRFPKDLATKLGRAPGRPADQRAIAERVYFGRMGNHVAGDGWRYRGAGILQLTGFDSHDACAQAFNIETAEVGDWLRTREGAVMGAAWWWAANGCNELADAEAIDAISRRINGGTNGLEDRRGRYLAARAALLRA